MFGFIFYQVTLERDAIDQQPSGVFVMGGSTPFIRTHDQNTTESSVLPMPGRLQTIVPTVEIQHFSQAETIPSHYAANYRNTYEQPMGPSQNIAPTSSPPGYEEAILCPSPATPSAVCNIQHRYPVELS